MICDVCGKPIFDGELIYTIATNKDKGTGRHYACKKARDAELRKGLDESMAKLHSAISRVKDALDRKKR